MPDPLAQAVLDSGLLAPRDTALVLISGGADSAAAAAGVSAALGAERVRALHLNYGLREDSDEDARTCALLCESLGIALDTRRVELEPGNVQAAAREARYAAAESLRSRHELGWVATGHTLTDVVETTLYRLASSPGRRALLGLAPRRGRVVRPLLSLTRSRVRELAAAAGLPFRDDPSNAEPIYARNRIRNEILPVLEAISPDPQRTIAATRSELAEEAEALEQLAKQALHAGGAGPGTAAVPAAALADLHPALRRLALRQLAERAAGGPVVLGPERAAEIMRLAREPEGGTVELGHGVEASLEHGHVRFSATRPDQPAEVPLPVPGDCRFGHWRLRAELVDGPPRPAGAEAATLDPEKLGGELRVRAWREGDRMRPLGLSGTKMLQDLFTDAKVPRSLRRELPVVLAGERIAWVAGVAVSEEFKLDRPEARAALLTARADT